MKCDTDMTGLLRLARDGQPNLASTGPLLHPVEGAAGRLGIGRTLMYELLEAGDLPSVRIFGRRLVAEADLVAYVNRLRERSR